MTESLTKEQKYSIGILSSGTFLEYFDFMMYIHMGVLLNDLFFPKEDALTTSLISALTFCMSFVFRIFSGMIFGWMGDNFGRKKVILATTSLMAISCLIMANLPTYDQIGALASVMMLLCRILQGMSSMGELLGAEIYLLETIRQRPLQYSIVSLMPIFSCLGAVAALGFANLIFAFDLSWRLAFWFGVIIACISFISRKKLNETPSYVNSRKTGTQLLDDLDLNEEDRKFFTDSAILNNTLINPKVSRKTILSYALIECPYALFMFLALIYASTILKDSFGYTPLQIIQHNFYVLLVDLSNYIIIVFLTYKIYPLLLFKVRLIIFMIFSAFIPYLLDNISTPFDLMVIQSIIMFLIPTSSCGASIFHSHVEVAKRFRYVAITFAVARAVMYIISSFGLIYLIKDFGYYGLFFLSGLFLPLCYWALRNFYTLEKENGVDITKWFNVPYLYKENFLNPVKNNIRKQRSKKVTTSKRMISA